MKFFKEVVEIKEIKTLKRKRTRNLVTRKINFDYGANVNKSDMDPETYYELAKSLFFKNRARIEQRTIIQSDCEE